MNPLRLNLVYALLSITLLMSLVSIVHPGRGPVRQAMRVTQRSAAALSNLSGFKSDRGVLPCINPAGALKQIVHSML